MAYRSYDDEDWLSDLLEKCDLERDEDKDDDFSKISLAIAKSEKLKMCVLKDYEVPKKVLNIETNQDHLNEISSEFDELLQLKSVYRSDESNYYRAYNMMIYLEEASQSSYLMQFNQKNIQLSYSGSEHEFLIKNEKKISKMVEACDDTILDCFTLKSKSSTRCISGQVRGCNKDYIFVEIGEEHFEYLKSHCNVELYDIFFHINRIIYQLQHYALDLLFNRNLFNVLINNPKYNRFSTKMVNLDEEKRYTFSGQLASKLNKEQRSAAINIVKARNSPLPYLLFGPAGTGKTGTLVAAIEEIVRSTQNYVLVCANSNAACDEITERLLKVLNTHELFRMYAKSYDYRKVSEHFKPVSNLKKREFYFPSLKFLYKIRVLICTLTTAGCVLRANEDSYFSASHFSHIIIDEAASTHETVGLIPIGICTTRDQVKSSIVLAGDPKQLDAVVKSENAKKMGYKTSYMEHLFNKKRYMRNDSGEYNQRFITQLVRNYRSHPTILNIPNALFYENKLQAKASTGITNWFIGSKLLPSKTFPVIFKSVQGMCKKSMEDFSMFNLKEVNVVIDYVKEILQNKNGCTECITQADIGIVTPYKLQSKVIARACRQNDFKDITIGTAEAFQGQEKPVMIVSTVRTGGILGFVNDPRRLNVVITRAKCLLIIVGDPHTLCLDWNWSQLIKYCLRNKALIQGEKPFSSVNQHFQLLHSRNLMR